MKKSFLLLITALAVLSSQAQEHKCLFEHNLEKMVEADPSAIQVLSDHHHATQEQKRARLQGQGRAGGPRIIPTVFHVIHNGGSENISYEQIEDQIRSLNEDFQRMNEDTANTRPEFQAVAANVNVEFRLAKLDPQGNCTDGVVRVMSPLTENASDESGVKGLSYWDSNDYFNVWVVNSIDNEGEAGIVLGYAQFPGLGAAETDGVVVRADRIGSIGTAAATGDKGRVLTHEAGHWLGLFHTFQGGCNPFWPFGETIDDTPPQAEATPSNCPLNANTCSTDNPDLPDMVENYMDYSNGSCQNSFTVGQKDAMDVVLDGNRSNLYSSGNLNDTGVLLSENPCAPIAGFYAERNVICEGDEITFTDGTYNGEVTAYSWDLPGATPNSSSDAEPTVTYSTAGVYSVTQTVTNAQGSDDYTRTDYVTVLPAQATNSWISFEGFEEQNEEYLIFSDGLGNTWEETTTSFTDQKAIVLKNFSGNPAGSIDEFQLAAVDLTQMNDPDLYFRLAYKQRNSETPDRLRVHVSDDCGESWSLRYTKQGGSLATVSGTQNSEFVPTTADWEQVSVNLANFADQEHILIRFQGKSEAGNNIYIDDIQISGPLSVADNSTELQFGVQPNPLVDVANIILNVEASDFYKASILDITGKQINSVFEGTLTTGSHWFELTRESLPSAGVYLIRVESDSARTTKKLIVQ
jgi:PKD repeat protein